MDIQKRLIENQKVFTKLEAIEGHLEQLIELVSCNPLAVNGVTKNEYKTLLELKERMFSKYCDISFDSQKLSKQLK